MAETVPEVAGVITQSTPTIAFASGYDPSKTFDGTAIAAPTADDMVITGASIDQVVFSWSADEGSTLTDDCAVDAGSYTLTAHIPETDNTHEATATLPVTIAKKQLTWDVSGLSAESTTSGREASVDGELKLTGFVEGDETTVTVEYGDLTTDGLASAGTGTHRVDVKSSTGFTFTPAEPINYELPTDAPQVDAEVTGNTWSFFPVMKPDTTPEKPSENVTTGAASDAAATTARPTATITEGAASAAVSDTMGAEIVAQAVANESGTVVIAPAMPDDVT